MLTLLLTCFSFGGPGWLEESTWDNLALTLETSKRAQTIWQHDSTNLKSEFTMEETPLFIA